MSDETMAAGRLLGDALAAGPGLVRDVHRAVAHRVFARIGPIAAPVRLVHDTVAEGIYAVIRGAHGAVPRAGAAVLALTGRDRPGWTRSPRAELALSAVNGLWGDTAAHSYPELAVPMELHDDAGRLVDPVSYPAATGRLVVFVHGWCSSDRLWRLGGQRHHGDAASTHGSRLRDDLGYTPLYLRYNTGLRISENGRLLAAQLDLLAAAWPVPVTEVALVGHSMGGLVVRSAATSAQVANLAWAASLRHVFALGAPHLGAPLEQGVNAACWLLAMVPETRPVAGLLNRRSVGVKDLRFGSCAEADWQGVDPDEYLRDRCTEVPFVPHAGYYFVAATLTRNPQHPISSLLGDLLVRYPSAAGDGPRRRIPFEVDNGAHLGGLHHLDLLNHPRVYDCLHRWMAASGATQGAVAA